MDNQRIRAIRDAAALLFLRQGYSRTQIGHIAQAVGVSVGTIYHDFTGKQEIMHLVLKSTIDPAFLDREFQRPITDDLFRGLDGEIAEAFARSTAEYARHLEEGAAEYSFRDFISDTFDLLSRYAVGCLFIEKNQFEFPRLAESYRQYRRVFFQTVEAHLSLFCRLGAIRPLEHVELTATLIVEMLTWWAMDRTYICFDDGASHIPAELAKQVCVDNLMAAYGA